MLNPAKLTGGNLGWMESLAPFSCRIDSDGRVLGCNPRLLSTLDYERGEQLAGADFAATVSEDAEGLRACVRMALSGPVVSQLHSFKLPKTGEMIRWYLCRQTDLEGQCALLALGWDAGSGDLLEQFLMLRGSVVELTQEAVVITNARGIVEYVNPAVTLATGYTAGEVIGRSLAGIVNVPEDSSSVQKALAAFHEGRAWEGILRVRRRDGEALTVSMRIYPVRGVDRTNSHFIAIGRDLSRQQQLQRQIEELQRLESLGTLSNGLAHRFNNILAAISGQTELLLMMPDKDVPRRAERILEAAQKGKEVVAQLTSFGRRNEPRSRPADLVPVVRNAVNFIRTAQPRSVAIEDQLPESSSLVMSNTGEIHQVLLNLLTNALEAVSDKGDGRIRVRMKEELRQVDPVRPPQPCVVISVMDNGTGVPQEIRHRIFEPFFTTRSLASSTGMGLATAHGIVARHSGCILCDDNVDGGAVFSVILPVLHGARGAKESAPQREKRGRVLLVDNPGFALEAGQRMLESLHYEVVALADPDAVREMLRDTSLPIGILIIPTVLHGQSTLPLAREARRLRKEMPVLLCASLDDPIDVGQARAAGVADIIRRPLPVEHFATVVAELMQP